MATTLTVKGQVTIPKRVRGALGLTPGDRVEFEVNGHGEVVVRKAGRRIARGRKRLESAIGSADIKWRTDELMTLLRG